MECQYVLTDNPDDPFDLESETFQSRPVAGRFDRLDDAVRAALLRAAELAEDPHSDACSVDVVMQDLAGSGGMEVLSVHIWFDHGVDRRWRDALRAELAPPIAPR